MRPKVFTPAHNTSLSGARLQQLSQIKFIDKCQRSPEGGNEKDWAQ
jgi:hypothetical protein